MRGFNRDYGSPRMGDLVRFLTESTWTYPLLLGIVAGDAIVPLLPSETAMIVCGLQAGRGELSLALVLLVGAAGAFLGDNTTYAVGRFVGRPVTRRLFRGERAQRRLEWAREQLRRRGAVIVLVARFVPGGRTATTFTAGVVRMPWPTRFAPFSALAAVLWSSYAALLGYLGGRTFEDRPWLGLLVALALAFAIAGVFEGVRRLRQA
jgi:membrane-associated protein